VTVSSTRPDVRLRKARIIKPVERIAVGNLGTSPVFIHSMTMGIASPTDRNASAAATMEKN